MALPFMKVAIANLFSKSHCERYPKVEKIACDKYRGRIVFHPDLCIGCGICERVCSPQAISTVIDHQEDGDHITRTFHMGSCTFCQTCVDFCPRHAIEMSKDYDMVVTNEDDLKVSGVYVKKPKMIPPKKPVSYGTGTSLPDQRKAPEGPAVNTDQFANENLKAAEEAAAKGRTENPDAAGAAPKEEKKSAQYGSGKILPDAEAADVPESSRQQ